MSKISMSDLWCDADAAAVIEAEAKAAGGIVIKLEHQRRTFIALPHHACMGCNGHLLEEKPSCQKMCAACGSNSILLSAARELANDPSNAVKHASLSEVLALVEKMRPPRRWGNLPDLWS